MQPAELAVAAPPSARSYRHPAAWIAAAIVLALAVALAGLLAPPAARRAATDRHAVAPLARTIPETPPPPVEPVAYADLTPDQARASNAAVPFDAMRMRAARPLLFAGNDADRAAARACLAAAVLYEAGDDRIGERAVAQVVLNRLRHPAFPKTVCGVVFQGSERTTGCQFTFTCDGAMARVPPSAAWGRAEDVADAALSGYVDTSVGTATHYHTDWVVPYWRDTLTKLTKVGTHIFYRWPGTWGERGAFTGRPQPFERLDPRLVPLAGPLPIAATDGDGDTPPPLPPRGIVDVPGAARGVTVRLADTDAGQFVVQLALDLPPADYPAAAARLCRGHASCLVFGWTDMTMMPRALPILPNGLAGMAFLYRKNEFARGPQSLLNCRRATRPERGQCLPGTD